MFLQNRKRINLTIKEKKWIVQHAEENKKNEQSENWLGFFDEVQPVHYLEN